MDRHLAIYMAAELKAYQRLQLMPAAKDQMTQRLTDGLCRGDHSCGIHQEPGPVYDLGGLEAVAEEAVENTLPWLHTWKAFLWVASVAGTLGGCMSLCIVGCQLTCFVGRHARRRVCGDFLRQRAIRRTVRRVDRRYSETEMENRTLRKRERDAEAEEP